MEETWELAAVSELKLTSVGTLGSVITQMSERTHESNLDTYVMLSRMANEHGLSDAAQFVGHLMKLVLEAQREVDESPALSDGLKGLANTSILGASKLFSEMLKPSKFAVHINSINTRGLVHNLRIVDEMILANGFKPSYDPSMAQEHAAAIEKIIDQIYSSELDASLKLILLNQLRLLRDIFERVTQLGLQNSDEITREILGLLLLRNKAVNEAPDDAKKAFRKLYEFFDKHYTPMKYTIDGSLIATQVSLLLLGAG